MTNKEKLFKLMQENPDLPIVFCCSTDEIDDSYSSMFYKDFFCDLVTIYETEEDGIFDHITEITEHYEYLYEDEYEDLSKEEFDKKIKELVEDTFQYKAIRIYCS